MEIFGPHFTLETAEMERAVLTRGPDQEAAVHDFQSLPKEEKWGYLEIDANFIAAVLGEEAPQVTAEDGYRAVELVDRIYRLLTQQAG